jgi:hypothetical protein
MQEQERARGDEKRSVIRKYQVLKIPGSKRHGAGATNLGEGLDEFHVHVHPCVPGQLWSENKEHQAPSLRRAYH